MDVLVSGSQGPLFDALIRSLTSEHQVTVWPDLGGASAQFDAIIHFAPIEETDEAAALETAGRLTSELFARAKANSRFILVSSLGVFESCPLEWEVTEDWRPRPLTRRQDLVVHVAEAVVRELTRTAPVSGIVLRIGNVVQAESAADPMGVDVEDAVRAIELALAFEPPAGNKYNWPYTRNGLWTFHITGAGATSRFSGGIETRTLLGYTPRHDVTGGLRAAAPQSAAPAQREEGKAIRKVTVFGAFGPLGAAVVLALGAEYELRLCDVRTFDQALKVPPAGRGDPRPVRPSGRFDERVVDIRDPDQVRAAMEGADAVINLSVMRDDPVLAYQVNLVGALNVMKAARDLGISKVVHTGPEQISDRQQGAYWPDFRIPSDAAPRPGPRLYFLSKFLGQEVCRIFAEQHGPDVVALVFGHLRNPADIDLDTIDGYPVAVSWADAAQAVLCALRARPLAQPFALFTIVADLPQEKVSNAGAKAQLGWEPKDRLEMLWTKPL